MMFSWPQKSIFRRESLQLSHIPPLPLLIYGPCETITFWISHWNQHRRWGPKMTESKEEKNNWKGLTSLFLSWWVVLPIKIHEQCLVQLSQVIGSRIPISATISTKESKFTRNKYKIKIKTFCYRAVIKANFAVNLHHKRDQLFSKTAISNTGI